MKLLLKETIRAGGQRYLPKTIVDTVEIGITDADADWLVRRGTAELAADPEAEANAAEMARLEGEAIAEQARLDAAAAEAKAKAESEAAAKATKKK